MRNGNNILTIDIGTSGCRAVLFSDSGAVLSSAAQQYRYAVGDGGIVEQDPDEIFGKFKSTAEKCLREGGRKARYAIISSVLHSLILLDKSDRPLAPMSIWADTRAIPQCREMEPYHHRKGLHRKTGCPLSPSYPVARLLWYRENEPGLFRRIARVASIKSYILLKLTGQHIEDCSVASGTGACDIKRRAWSADIIDYLGLEPGMFPEIVPAGHACDSLLPKYRGFKGVTFVAGAADGPLAHLGSAGRDPRAASLTIGTSGAARMLVTRPEPCTDPARWCYVLDEKSYVSGYSTNNGGNVVDWYVKNFIGARTSWRALDRALESTRLDKGLFFSPFLFGERVFAAKSAPRAAFSGLEAKHGRDDLLRAVIEGVVFNAVSMLERLNPDLSKARVYTSGSLVKSGFVRTVLASLLKEARFNGRGVHEGLLSIAGEAKQAIPGPQDGGEGFEANVPAPDYLEKFKKWKRLLNQLDAAPNKTFTSSARCSS